MSYNAEIQSNNADLQTILDKVNALPEAGSGEAAEPVIEALEVTANGTYEAPSGTDGYNPVVVNVPVPDGYIQPSGSVTITENGTHDVSEYASAEVNVPSENLDTEIAEQTTTLDEQAALISELRSLLESKAAGGGGEVGGLTQYVKFTATPTSNVTFTITNPLGGLAKKISIRCPEGSTTESAQGLVQLYTMDTTVGLGCMKLINASTGNITIYGSRQTDAASANSQFAITEGEVKARAYNATTATWDTTCAYEIEIWQ